MKRMVAPSLKFNCWCVPTTRYMNWAFAWEHPGRRVNSGNIRSQLWRERGSADPHRLRRSTGPVVAVLEHPTECSDSHSDVSHVDAIQMGTQPQIRRKVTACFYRGAS